MNTSSICTPVPLTRALNFSGINVIKVFCDTSQGYKAAQVSLLGSVGMCVSPETHERLTRRHTEFPFSELYTCEQSKQTEENRNN